MHAVYAGTVHLDAADRAAGTATLRASGRERSGQGSADASVTLRVEPHGASTRVLISADLMIRGTVAQYAQGAIGDVASAWWSSSPATSSGCWPPRRPWPQNRPPPLPAPPGRPAGWAARAGKRGRGHRPWPAERWPAAWAMWHRRAAGGWPLGSWPPVAWLPVAWPPAGRPPAGGQRGPAPRTRLFPGTPRPKGLAMADSHAPDTQSPSAAELRPLQIEANGINVISDAERKGHPRDLFWPWFAANVSVLGLGYGAFVLGFGVSFWQAVALGLIGIVVSFLLCGFIAVAGKRGSAPTMVLGRAAFGVRGNKLPSLISWLLTVGWETVLIILATLATATVFERLGWGGGTGVKVIALIVVSALTVAGGVMGFDLIMRMQSVITWVTGVLTVVFIALVADKIHWHTVSAIPAGSPQKFIGALVFMMTGFGLGWVNAAADYSRYLPRRSSSRGVIGWTTFGSSIAPIVLLIFGLLLAGSSAKPEHAPSAPTRSAR